MSMFLTRVGDQSHESLAKHMVTNLGQSDRAESYATGNLYRLQEVLEYGFETSKCFMLVEKEKQDIISVGGYCVDTSSIWLVTTKAAESLTKRERVQAIFLLRGFLKKLLKTYPETTFRNEVSIANKNHIKLIKALGGKGFNTMTYNPKNDSKFYPFHFQYNKE